MPPIRFARRTTRNDPLDQAFLRLQDMLPDKAGRALCWLHHPDSRLVRMPLGILCVIGGFLSFLPILGIELLPIGLLLIAQDIPVLRKPVGKGMIPLLNWTERMIGKWKAQRPFWAKST